MSLNIRTILVISVVILVAFCAGCVDGGEGDQPDEDEGGLGRYIFDVPTTITDIGTIDTPRMAADSNLRNVHLTYLVNDGGSQRIQYMELERGEITRTSLLSEQEGRKIGGGNLTFLDGDLVAYWINVKATGGQLRYRTKSGSERNFSRPGRWNERDEARWPTVIKAGNDTVAYFFLHARDEWELAGNRNFTDEKEPTIDIPQGTPFHLQAVSDNRNLVWLAYFERRDNSDGGRLAFLKSEDGGRSFVRRYLFDDLVIRNISSFFRIERTVHRGNAYIHLIFAEETPDLTTIYYSRSSDDGEQFSIPVVLFSSEHSLTQAPLLLVRERYVFVATADTEVDGPAIRYLLSETNGESFREAAVAARNVSSPETIAGVIGSDASVILVWDDMSADPTQGEQLYLMNGRLRG